MSDAGILLVIESLKLEAEENQVLKKRVSK